jgi:catalase
MTDTDRDHLISNIVGNLGGAQKRIQLCQTAFFYKAEPDFGRRVAKGLKLAEKEMERPAKMSPDEWSKVAA